MKLIGIVFLALSLAVGTVATVEVLTLSADMAAAGGCSGGNC
jgi:hypothetical protein